MRMRSWVNLAGPPCNRFVYGSRRQEKKFYIKTTENIKSDDIRQSYDVRYPNNS